MEKPVTVDGPTTRKMRALADKASRKNLKVAVGLMWRHCQARRELFDRVQQGEIGALTMLRTYRLHGPIGFFSSPPKPDGISDLRYQVQRFHSFLWASGGCYSDFYIHNIDELCWMKGAWPVEARPPVGRCRWEVPGTTTGADYQTRILKWGALDSPRMRIEKCGKTACRP
jgi:predicted dehydrogenase